jgi:hypothetical protein
VGVGQEEEEGELETSASAASRRGIGRQIALNGDAFLVIWCSKIGGLGRGDGEEGGRKKAFFVVVKTHSATHSSQANASVQCADFVSSRGAGMGKGGERGVEEEAKRWRKGGCRRWNSLC